VTRIPFEDMQCAIHAALVNAGMRDRDAEICARIHTESSCDGVTSHGVDRVSRFVDLV
jgi:3-dehydro-L-gulonate 2-dehydrogenase